MRDHGQVQLAVDLAAGDVDHRELLGLGVDHEGGAVGHRHHRAGLLPVVRLAPLLGHRDLVEDVAGLGVQDVQLAVGGEHEGLAIRSAIQRPEPVLGSEVDDLLGVVTGVDQGDLGGALDAALGVGLDLSVGQHDRGVLMALLIAGALVVALDVDLVELTVAVDHRTVLTAQADDVAGLGGLGGGLAVHARAVVGLGGDLAVGVEHLDGVALVLGALGAQQPTIGQRHRDPVVRIGCGGLLDHAEVAVGKLARVDHGDAAGAVGEQSGAIAVGDDVPGHGGVERQLGERRILRVVVEVVAVGLGDQAGVVHGDRVRRADCDMAAVPGGIQAHEAVDVSRAEGAAVGGVEGGHAAVVGEHDPRGQRAHLGAVRGRSRLAAAVGGTLVGGAPARAAARGQREHARAEQGDSTSFHDNGSHLMHERNTNSS